MYTVSFDFSKSDTEMVLISSFNNDYYKISDQNLSNKKSYQKKVKRPKITAPREKKQRNVDVSYILEVFTKSIFFNYILLRYINNLYFVKIIRKFHDSFQSFKNVNNPFLKYKIQLFHF